MYAEWPAVIEYQICYVVSAHSALNGTEEKVELENNRGAD